ncbi:UDP-N-acetylenolpyruvoylglucosamine reductase [Kingella potus]|uniref:UDP-N-acetylenolpyruvoylglucosamine reductase n=1 Tax=Kingella potus TaxID=265175 RepID=A0A377R168_9NEIS|nr:UDP-N-acetylmuramate dehydrogenase [Kingella potus]STR00740.1 UDP-N-acetylenolpyruvoylglucosamine reductase [Kingella potus]
MNITEHADLRPFNTFGLPARARRLAVVAEAAQLPQLCALPFFDRANVLWLGGGSNIVLRGDHSGTVVRIANRGIREVRRSGSHVWLEAQAGENWHGFVRHTLAQGLSGLENLSLIPGTVGASPVQNIGAYGVEAKDLIDTVRCYDLDHGRFADLPAADCRFAYRDSLFKREGRGRYVITSVVFKLSRRFVPQTGYGDLAAVLAASCSGRPATAADVSEAVCRIRQSKLPDPALLGNAGSFFKNPAVSAAEAAALAAAHPALPRYPQPDGTVKLAAGWLIDQCGLKGRRIGGAAVHDRQALVLVNTGQATAADVAELAALVRDTVAARFGVRLESEPEWV